MPRSRKVRRVARSIEGLFRAPKTNITVQRHPELYYKHVWLDQPLYEAIDFLAKVNRTSRKQVLHDMLELGIGHYFGASIAEQNRLAATQRERGEPLRPTYFIVMLRHWAKQKGYDINKFI